MSSCQKILPTKYLSLWKSIWATLRGLSPPSIVWWWSSTVTDKELSFMDSSFTNSNNQEQTDMITMGYVCAPSLWCSWTVGVTLDSPTVCWLCLSHIICSQSLLLCHRWNGPQERKVVSSPSPSRQNQMEHLSQFNLISDNYMQRAMGTEWNAGHFETIRWLKPMHYLQLEPPLVHIAIIDAHIPSLCSIYTKSSHSGKSNFLYSSFIK